MYTRGDLEIDLEILESLRHRARQALIDGETGPGNFEKLMAKFDEQERRYRNLLVITALQIKEREDDRRAGRKPRWLGPRKYSDGLPREKKPRDLVEVVEGSMNDPNRPMWVPCKKELAMKMMAMPAARNIGTEKEPIWEPTSAKPVRCVRENGKDEGHWEILI